ncbi:hypothetical protein JOM56_001728 [Amanita muscaria]
MYAFGSGQRVCQSRCPVSTKRSFCLFQFAKQTSSSQDLKSQTSNAAMKPSISITSNTLHKTDILLINDMQPKRLNGERELKEIRLPGSSVCYVNQTEGVVADVELRNESERYTLEQHKDSKEHDEGTKLWLKAAGNAKCRFAPVHEASSVFGASSIPFLSGLDSFNRTASFVAIIPAARWMSSNFLATKSGLGRFPHVVGGEGLSVLLLLVHSALWTHQLLIITTEDFLLLVRRKTLPGDSRQFSTFSTTKSMNIRCPCPVRRGEHFTEGSELRCPEARRQESSPPMVSTDDGLSGAAKVALLVNGTSTAKLVIFLFHRLQSKPGRRMAHYNHVNLRHQGLYLLIIQRGPYTFSRGFAGLAEAERVAESEACAWTREASDDDDDEKGYLCF